MKLYNYRNPIAKFAPNNPVDGDGDDDDDDVRSWGEEEQVPASTPAGTLVAHHPSPLAHQPGILSSLWFRLRGKSS